MTTSTSRRAVLAGAATLPALAVPVLASAAADEDLAGVTARTEQVIDLLRTCYVGPNWKIDEEAAEKVLQWAHAGAPDDDGFQFAVDFFGRHGQSLDWVFLGDPGGMICKGAAHSQQAAVAGSLTPDPIYAAIEAHRSAWASLEEATAGEGVADALVDQWHERVDATQDALAEVVPTSIAGIVALLDYVADHEANTGDAFSATYDIDSLGVPWRVLMHRNMATALRNITVQS